MRGMRAPEGRRALARPDKLAARASPAETFFGRGHLPPRAPGILRFCSTLGVSVFHHLTAATAGQGLQHELGVQHAAVCGVGSGRRGWRQPWVRGGRKGGVKAVDSAQLPPRPAECAPAPCDMLSVPPPPRPSTGVTMMAARPAAQKTKRIDACARLARCLAAECPWKATPVMWDQRTHSGLAFPLAG